MIVSFYSYKGGVGRTQLCANIAAYFYYQKNKRVLLWDWDWEAPGLHYFFNKTNEDININGTLELFEDYLILMRTNANAKQNSNEQRGVKPEDINYISNNNIINLVNASDSEGCIDLLPAGNYTTNFSDRANNFDWYDFYNMKDGVNYIELIKDNLKNLNYDYILIDSRTGISDYSGICNIQLPEINVMVIAPTMQNFVGCKTIIKKIENSEYLKIKEREPQILPILSRLDRNSEKYTFWQEEFAKYFSQQILRIDKNLAPDFLPDVFRDVYYNDTFLPYTTAISVGENIFANDKNISKSHYGWPFLNIAELIEELKEKGGTDFYKKIDESSWFRYAASAIKNNNKKKAAIAYTQIAYQQKEPSKQVDFFGEAAGLDPDNKDFAENLIKANANLRNDEKHTPYNPQINDTSVVGKKLNNRNEPGKPIYKSFNLFTIIAASLLAICGGILLLLFLERPNRIFGNFSNAPDSLKNNVKRLAKDSMFFVSPVINGSPYFDSIRNQKKPIGIDINSRNRIYDLSKTKDYGISFVMVKATEGKTSKDPNFEINWLAVQQTRVIRGAYHYFTVNNFAKPAAQAANYIKNVNLINGDLPPILNLGEYDKNFNKTRESKIENQLKLYLDRISIHYGAKPIVFITGDFAKYFLSGSVLSSCYLWKNQPNQDLPKPDQTPGWKKWTFWQFYNKETLKGILTDTDEKNKTVIGANQFNGSNQDLLNVRLKPSVGRSAVMEADSFITDPKALFSVINTDRNHIKYNNTIFAADSFKQIKFNWNVELINRCFSSLKTPSLYGKDAIDLFNLLKSKNYIVDRKTEIKIGDIAFYGFQSKNVIQNCGLVYNYDDTFVYTIESYDDKGQLLVHTEKHFILEVIKFARFPN